MIPAAGAVRACANPPNLLAVPSAQAKDEIFKATK